MRHVYIKPRTPRLNGKVERSHKTDATEFYQLLTYKDDQDLRAKLRIWEDFYNLQRPHAAHSGKTPFRSPQKSVSILDDRQPRSLLSQVNNHAHVLRPLAGMPASYLNVSLAYYDFTPLTSGSTGRRKLTQEALLSAPLSVPPLPEQQEIVRRVDQLFAFADRLEARVETARKRVDALTHSILAKAFRGELVPTEAELARAEGRAYESAAQLLEHIASLNTKSTDKPKRKPPKRKATA